MSGAIDLPLPDPGSLERGRFTYFPVVPGRLEFALEVRQAILRQRPQVIALELPATLQGVWMRAVARLPEMSLIFYPDETAALDQAIYVPIEPADPFTEAVRTALSSWEATCTGAGAAGGAQRGMGAANARRPGVRSSAASAHAPGRARERAAGAVR